MWYGEDIFRNDFDRSINVVSTLANIGQISSTTSSYAHLQWRKYFPKLLKEKVQPLDAT